MKPQELENLTRENAAHIKIINNELGELSNEQKILGKEHTGLRQDFNDFKQINASEHSEIKNDLSWLKKLQWLIVATSIGALIANLIRL